MYKMSKCSVMRKKCAAKNPNRGRNTRKLTAHGCCEGAAAPMPGCFASEGKASRQGVQRAGSAEHCVKSFGKISPLAGGRSPRRDCYILYGDSDIAAK